MDVDEDGTRTKDEPDELALPSTEEIYDDFLDPSVRPPYLPFKTVEFSCRPDGPKLYDLLGAKSLDPFGILAWSIIDREEELFEVDGVRDEDKVMQALWCRWIMLNRYISLGPFLITFADHPLGRSISSGTICKVRSSS